MPSGRPKGDGPSFWACLSRCRLRQPARDECAEPRAHVDIRPRTAPVFGDCLDTRGIGFVCCRVAGRDQFVGRVGQPDAPNVEIVADVLAAPIDRDRVGEEAVDNFFGEVKPRLAVFDG